MTVSSRLKKDVDCVNILFCWFFVNRRCNEIRLPVAIGPFFVP